MNNITVEINRLREKRRRSRGEKRRRRSDSQKRRKRRSRSRKRDEPRHIGEIRKLKYKEKGESVRSPRHKISNSRLEADIGNTSGSPNRKRSKTKRRNPSNYSDLSDCSDYEDRKAKGKNYIQCYLQIPRHFGRLGAAIYEN